MSRKTAYNILSEPKLGRCEECYKEKMVVYVKASCEYDGNNVCWDCIRKAFGRDDEAPSKTGCVVFMDKPVLSDGALEAVEADFEGVADGEPIEMHKYFRKMVEELKWRRAQGRR